MTLHGSPQDEMTPLMVAAWSGRAEIVELLLSYNASINKGDSVSACNWVEQPEITELLPPAFSNEYDHPPQ